MISAPKSFRLSILLSNMPLTFAFVTSKIDGYSTHQHLLGVTFLGVKHSNKSQPRTSQSRTSCCNASEIREDHGEGEAPPLSLVRDSHLLPPHGCNQEFQLAVCASNFVGIPAERRGDAGSSHGETRSSRTHTHRDPHPGPCPRGCRLLAHKQMLMLTCIWMMPMTSGVGRSARAMRWT